MKYDIIYTTKHPEIIGQAISKPVFYYKGKIRVTDVIIVSGTNLKPVIDDLGDNDLFVDGLIVCEDIILN